MKDYILNTDNRKIAKASINKYVLEKDQYLLKKRKKEDKPIIGSSFLYMRSFHGDTGSRPFNDQIRYLSPDIEIYPINNPDNRTRRLRVGDQYVISATIRNAGDIDIPSAKVEFYLADLTLGFATNFAELISIQESRVQAFSSSKVEFEYRPTNDMAGHKCLFARTFSMFPPDFPINDTILNPTLDRHIAQKNLTIISTGETISFQLIHHPNTNEEIKILFPDEREIDLKAYDALALHKFDSKNFLKLSGLKINENRGASIKVSKNEIQFTSKSKETKLTSLEQLIKVQDQVDKIVSGKFTGKRLKKNRLTTKDKSILNSFRDISKEYISSKIEITPPKLNIAEQEIAVFDLVSYEANGQVKGGIRVILKP